MKAVVYALSSFQQQVMPGLWKDITTKIHHKVSENWISTTLLVTPVVGTYQYVPPSSHSHSAPANGSLQMRPVGRRIRFALVACGSRLASRSDLGLDLVILSRWSLRADSMWRIMEIQSMLASGMCGAGHAVARWPRTVFIFTAMTCMFVSAAAHLLASHSRRFNRLFWQLNYAGYGELFSRYIDDADFQFRRIEDFKPVALPKSDYGKFYSGDSSIVLQIAHRILNKKELEFYKWEVLQRIHARQWTNEQTILE
ncbi:hypothetical protein ZWY2020_050270 [Hordeum vulgare]|nr:hypothetical protein ZWY2020_050270 [Hordeum vulgare]